MRSEFWTSNVIHVAKRRVFIIDSSQSGESFGLPFMYSSRSRVGSSREAEYIDQSRSDLVTIFQISNTALVDGQNGKKGLEVRK